MMASITAGLVGVFAAVIVFVVKYLNVHYPELYGYAPVAVLGIGAFSIYCQKFLLDHKSGSAHYDGLADVLMNIHAPLSLSSAARWFARAIQSFLLCVLGGVLGPEGAAIEAVQAFQLKLSGRATRWFEQKRRTDSAVSLAAGISAAFCAPFAGVLFPLELGIGGKSIASAISSILAFLSIQFLMVQFSLEYFDIGGVVATFHFDSWRELLGIALIGVAAGLSSCIVIYFTIYSQTSLRALFQTRAWIKTMAGAVLLALLFLIQKPDFFSSQATLQQVLWIQHSPSEVAWLFAGGLLAFIFSMTSFGTLGIFWPLLALGGLFGFCLNQWVLDQFVPDFTTVAGVLGGVSFLSAFVGAPLSSAVLAYELTQNAHLFLPCLIASTLAHVMRKLVMPKSLTERQLELKDFSLVAGRSSVVLNSVSVREAMVTDFELVHEHEPLADLYSKLLAFRYPFLPVVSSQGVFQGLLTVDMIESNWNSELPAPDAEPTPLLKLMVAKDLLYRSRVTHVTIKVSEALAKVVGRFDESPCIPVLSEEGKILGLLFSFSVRQAYERELVRQSFSVLARRSK